MKRQNFTFPQRHAAAFLPSPRRRLRPALRHLLQPRPGRAPQCRPRGRCRGQPSASSGYFAAQRALGAARACGTARAHYGGPPPHFVPRDGLARTEGRAGCNRFSGPYSAPAVGQLRLGPLPTTRTACPDLATEAKFLRALNRTQQYRISGTTLSLYAADTLGAPLPARPWRAGRLWPMNSGGEPGPLARYAPGWPSASSAHAAWRGQLTQWSLTSPAVCRIL
ncbi:META domain-containing protein [Hymenobacter lapidarius]|uniref:META domain-containing protein n=1 Tax=Hymenobacter lapidarius TaxID=1908237 RepID=UPI0034DB521C